MVAQDSTLFKPLQVGKIHLGQRIAMAPLTRCRATDGHVHTDMAVEYYSQRANYPGTLVISEATFISKNAQGWNNVASCYSPEQLAAWKKIVAGVHSKGSYIFLQLWALGRAAQPDALERDDPSLEVVGPSDVPFEGGAKPRPLSEEEIRQYVKEYAACAKAFVEECGGDGVEIHGANGYLIDQFIQTTSNKRTDAYGGSVENRLRFPFEVIEAVTSAVGQDRVGIRASPFSRFQGQRMDKHDIVETFGTYFKEIKRRYPDFAYLHLLSPRAAGDGDAKNEEGDTLDDFAKLWAPKVLLVAGGNVDHGERVVNEYENSVAVYGRAFISNPDLVARLKHGVDIRPWTRESFYLEGPDKIDGYTTYPIEYGPNGKLSNEESKNAASVPLTPA